MKRFLKYDTEDAKNGVGPVDKNGVIKKDISGGGGVQPDWNQLEESEPDFIKNKPFGLLRGVEIVHEYSLESISRDSNGNYIFSCNLSNPDKVYSLKGPCSIKIGDITYENIQVEHIEYSMSIDYIFQTDGLPFSLNINYIRDSNITATLNLTYSDDNYIGEFVIYDHGATYTKFIDTTYLNLDYLSKSYFPKCYGLSAPSNGMTIVYNSDNKGFMTSYDVYLKSSTSNKKFKLIVDDSGTLSTEEITS